MRRRSSRVDVVVRSSWRVAAHKERPWAAISPDSLRDRLGIRHVHTTYQMCSKVAARGLGGAWWCALVEMGSPARLALALRAAPLPGQPRHCPPSHLLPGPPLSPLSRVTERRRRMRA